MRSSFDQKENYSNRKRGNLMKGFLRPHEVGKEFGGVTRQTITAWIKKGLIPGEYVKKIGTYTYIDRSWVRIRVSLFNAGKIKSLP